MPSTTFSNYLPNSERVVYVDITNGNDSNRGNSILSPLKTLPAAFAKSSNNTLIVLQNGSYGSLSINKKDIFILGAYGASPQITNISATDSHLNLYNIGFSGASTGVSITNSLVNKSSVSIRRCSFASIATAVNLVRCKSISLHQNNFLSCPQSVVINGSDEATVSSNVVSSASVAFQLTSVGQLDLYHNTIDGSVALSSQTDNQIHVIYYTIVTQDIINKYITIPDFIYSIAINVVTGPTLALDTDFIFNGNIILWGGLGLDGIIEQGDILRIAYTKNTDPTLGSAIILNSVGSGSRIDSNNITDANIGVFLSPNIKVTNNNFFNTTTPESGSPPLVYTGNIFTGNPDYVNIGTDDFHLQAASASLGKANPTRWEDVFQEMHSFNKWDAASFNRNLDRDGVNRFHLHEPITGSIGAYEFVSGVFTPLTTDSPAFISESGYDFSNFGGKSNPYFTPDRGFSQTSTNPVNMVVGTKVGKLAINVGRFTTNDLELSNAPFQIGNNLTGDFAIIYPTYPYLPTENNVYVSEDGGDNATGLITGDGSLLAPYRSIDKALQGVSSNIILFPGRYKKFTQGKSGKRIIPLKTSEVSNTSKEIYTQFSLAGWSTSVTGTVVPQLDTTDLVFDHTVHSGTAEVNSVFNVVNNSDGVELRFKALIGTNLKVELYTDPPSTITIPPAYPPNTPDNELFFEMNGTELSVGYKKLTTENLVQKNLSFPVYYDLTEFEVSVAFLINGSSFQILVNSSQLNIVRNGNFEQNFSSPHTWKVRFASGDPTPSFSDNLTDVSNLKLIVGDFTGVTGFGESRYGYPVGRGPSILEGK